MFRKVDHKNMGRANHGWLNTHFHFSFANYYNPNNMSFGALRVINDDLVAAQTGFDMHPHRDMEIISYVVDGALTHEDSMGNRGTIERGHVQYMSAGTGVFHSEHNLGNETLRLLQIWILPDRADHKPNYGEFKFDWSKRENEWFHMVSPVDGDAPIQIHQDANLYSLSLEAGKEIHFPVKEGRQLYLVQIEGSSVINGEILVMRDAAEAVEEDIHIQAKEQSHYLAIELKNNKMFIKRGHLIGCPLFVWNYLKNVSQIFGRGIGLKIQNFIKVSKIFMGMGNVIVKKQVISSALALTVIAGDLERLEQRQRKQKNKNSISSRI